MYMRVITSVSAANPTRMASTDLMSPRVEVAASESFRTLSLGSPLREPVGRAYQVDR